MWELGRQGTGYFKKLLAKGKTWDLYLLKYPPLTHIPQHTDPVPCKKHYRLNVVLRGADSYRGDSLVRLPRVVLFRPDYMMHAVQPTEEERLVLSLGWVR